MAVLLVGSTGNGKSTLGNFLLDPNKLHTDRYFAVSTANRSETSHTEFKTAPVKFVCWNTEDCDNDDIEEDNDSMSTEETATALPIAQDSSTDPVPEDDSLGDLSMDDPASKNASLIDRGKKFIQKGLKLMKKATDSQTEELINTPVLKEKMLTVIDTPGLNETPKKDLEHMIELVQKLNEAEDVQACIFVVKFDSKIDQQYRDTIKYFARLQPSLFSNNCFIVMTHYRTDSDSLKRREQQGIQVDEVKSNVKKQVQESANICYEPILFALDCCPLENDSEEIAIARKTRDSIISCIFSQRPINTKELLLAKTKSLLKEDQKYIKCYEGEIEGYNTRLKEANEDAKAVLTTVQRLEYEITKLENACLILNEKLRVYDTKESLTTASWSVDDTWKWLEWQSREFQVESEWEITEVTKWTNGRSRWTNVKKDENLRIVSGVLEGKFMRGLYAKITVFTRSDIKFASEISELKEEIERKRKAKDDHSKELQQEIDAKKAQQKLTAMLQIYIKEKNALIKKRSGHVMTLAEARNRLSELSDDED